MANYVDICIGPLYTEGYLSALKDRVVSNSRLCRVAMEAKLDRFIMSKRFTGTKWRPHYREVMLESARPEETRKMSTKTLADVVESLIGAAYLDGEMPMALTCVKRLLPKVEWLDLNAARLKLEEQCPVNMTELPSTLAPIEGLIGYTFRKKGLLVEAMTYGSYYMQRLEFLGDAILDSVVVSALWKHGETVRELSQGEMHLLRTASVNADFLGFLAMELATTQDETKIADDEAKTAIITETKMPFWKFIRFPSPELAIQQRETEQRHGEQRGKIIEALASGENYPWAALAHVQIPKYFSDVLESLIGAVWIDSGCSMEACAGITGRLGILGYLQRLLRGNVEAMHPKNLLGEIVGTKKVKYKTEWREVVAVEDGDGDVTEHTTAGDEEKSSPETFPSHCKSKHWCCKVFVDGEFVVEVEDGVGNEEVQTRAADVAIRILRDRTRDEYDDLGDVMMSG